ncbi:DsrE family protein [Celeribacter neptunius]|uniref:Uncharacterized protein n=1 Tax=Celeribacter neptunius TaxID=588602 RepID=A0A1I3RZ59_9RHOB|nr:DsrE family protein [Celeribacter neptunius]SFJ50556.1 hypothetical protein SAMN04487991_2233 [Celeribacter neptunius]
MLRTLAACAALTLMSGTAMTDAARAEGVSHKIAIHVDDSDMRVMNMALNNAENARSYFASIGDTVELELVAYGPGLQMFVKDQSPVAARIAAMSLEFEEIQFSACGNTIKNMAKKLGHEPVLIEEAEVVPSGVARLVELQEDGYSYIRP